MKLFYILICFLCAFQSNSQDLNGYQLLDNAIAYHDPNGNWNSFQGTFSITMNSPEQEDRMSEITIDLPNDFFHLKVVQGNQETTYTVAKGKSIVCRAGPSNERTSTPISNEKANLYKNYYTYLYGLPMKLRDPGTHIQTIVEKRRFKGKEYLTLKVTYDNEVDGDVWFIYFDPKTYKMEVYQFYKGDPDGVGKNTGEYILLSEEVIINGIKMPKNRAWYYNKDDMFLGIDILSK